jgi:hypothetical protein
MKFSDWMEEKLFDYTIANNGEREGEVWQLRARHLTAESDFKVVPYRRKGSETNAAERRKREMSPALVGQWYCLFFFRALSSGKP